MGINMDQQDILNRLQEHRPTWESLGAKSLAIFGSVARDQARPNSDIDVLVVFAGSPTFDQYMELKFFLEEICGRPVDLVTVESVRPQLWPNIKREAIYVS
jgi:predicted nucleotidyltransferase